MRRSRRPYQFSMLRLLVLMTAIAAVAAFAQGLSITASGQVIVGAYLAVFVAWLVMRWPVVYGGLVAVRRRRHAILKERRAMAKEIEARRSSPEAKRLDLR